MAETPQKKANQVWSLYWCHTKDKGFDWFVIARTQEEAITEFCLSNLYMEESVVCEFIDLVPSSVQSFIVEPELPKLHILEKCGIWSEDRNPFEFFVDSVDRKFKAGIYNDIGGMDDRSLNTTRGRYFYLYFAATKEKLKDWFIVARNAPEANKLFRSYAGLGEKEELKVVTVTRLPSNFQKITEARLATVSEVFEVGLSAKESLSGKLVFKINNVSYTAGLERTFEINQETETRKKKIKTKPVPKVGDVWSLYWLATREWATDWFVVARTQKQAKEFFAQQEGYDIERLVCERVITLPKELQSELREPDWASPELLERSGGTILNDSAPVVVNIGGSVYVQGLPEEQRSSEFGVFYEMHTGMTGIPPEEDGRVKMEVHDHEIIPKGPGRPRKQENDLARWIDEHRKPDGGRWTRDEVAIRLGVSRHQLDNICAGRAAPSLRVAVKIEELTGLIRCSYWVKGEE
jgi:DNA-binding XRE family transcriptional regulator